eukprot:scaffold2550_cov153-Skeletonema_menzelii.AAC.5
MTESTPIYRDSIDPSSWYTISAFSSTPLGRLRRVQHFTVPFTNSSRTNGNENQAINPAITIAATLNDKAMTREDRLPPSGLPVDDITDGTCDSYCDTSGPTYAVRINSGIMLTNAPSLNASFNSRSTSRWTVLTGTPTKVTNSFVLKTAHPLA